MRVSTLDNEYKPVPVPKQATPDKKPEPQEKPQLAVITNIESAKQYITPEDDSTFIERELPPVANKEPMRAVLVGDKGLSMLEQEAARVAEKNRKEREDLKAENELLRTQIAGYAYKLEVKDREAVRLSEAARSATQNAISERDARIDAEKRAAEAEHWKGEAERYQANAYTLREELNQATIDARTSNIGTSPAAASGEWFMTDADKTEFAVTTVEALYQMGLSMRAIGRAVNGRQADRKHNDHRDACAAYKQLLEAEWEQKENAERMRWLHQIFNHSFDVFRSINRGIDLKRKAAQNTRFTIDAKLMLNAAKHAALASDPKSNVKVLGCLLIEPLDSTRTDGTRLRISGFDHRQAVTCTIPVGHGFEEIGFPVAIPAQQLIRALETAVKGAKKNTIAEVAVVMRTIYKPDDRPTYMQSSCAEITINGSLVKGLDADDFPPIPMTNLDGEPYITFNTEGETLTKALSGVVFATNDADPRPFTGGVYISENATCATDGHRLVRRDLFLEGYGGPFRAIIPARACAILNKLVVADSLSPVFANIGGIKNDNNKYARFGFMCKENFHVHLATRLVEADFPNYNKVVPSAYKYRYEIDVKEFVAAVQAAQKFAVSKENHDIISLTFLNDTLTIHAETLDVGAFMKTIDARPHGTKAVAAEEPFTMQFNARYLTQPFCKGGIETDTFCFESIGEQLKATVLTAPDDQSYKYILMPIKI